MAGFDHNTYRSLNASINGVQNQPAALDEMAQTPARAKEMGKRIAAERDPKKKAYIKQWDAGEKVSNRTYGTKGRIIKAHRPGSHQEAVEYAEFLEGILDNLCEELGLDPQAVMEDIQTAEREREMRPLVRKAIKKQDAARADTARETERRAMRGDPVMRNWDLKNIRAKYSKKYGLRKKDGPNEIIARDNKERKDSTTLYGKGGKKVATLKPTKRK
jgi:hypothetical protein